MSRLTPSEIITALQEVPLFSSLNESGLEKLLRACPTKNLPAGSQVFSPLQQAESFYVILAGKVKVYKLSSKGDEQILHLYGPGKTFGEAAMWAGIRYPAHGETLAETSLLVVSRNALKNLISNNADLALAMLAGMSAKLREFNQLIEQLSLREVPARLASVLLELSRQTRSDTIILKQTKRELAGQIGTIAETLSRAFRKLKDMKSIEVNGSKISILNAEKLEELADKQ